MARLTGFAGNFTEFPACGFAEAHLLVREEASETLPGAWRMARGANRSHPTPHRFREIFFQHGIIAGAIPVPRRQRDAAVGLA